MVINNTKNKTLDIIPYTKELNVVEAAYTKIKEENIDFVFCHCDSLAIGIMSYLNKKKYKTNLKVLFFKKTFDNLVK